MEQLRLTLSDNSAQLREAVKIAWLPNSQTQGTADTPAKDKYQLPVPLGADEAHPAEDDTDPTDGFLDEYVTGRHDSAIIADDGDLVKDGKYLGIPGLVPPPGVLDASAMQMLDYSSRLLQQVPKVPSPSYPSPSHQAMVGDVGVPPGSVLTPQFPIQEGGV